MIKPAEFIHPEDAAALNALKAIPGLTTLTKLFLEYGYEKMYYGQNLGSCIKLSPTQLPHIYKHLPPICDKLGIEEPEFYLSMDPAPNAWTFGETYKFICVTSGLIEMLTDDEIDAVIAHECGHIMCKHSLYHSLARILCEHGASALMSLGLTEAMLLALYYWDRKGELSCDRVAALVTSPDTVTRVHVRLSGGSKHLTSQINIREWIEQADKYEQIYNESGFWDRAVQMYSIMYRTHPYSAVRVREIQKWGEDTAYLNAKKQINVSNEPRCSTCGKQISLSHNYCPYCSSKL